MLSTPAVLSTLIYLDNAASTPMAPEVWEAMAPWLQAHYGNPSSTHAWGRKLRNAIEESRRTIAGHLGAQPGEIYFTSGGTEADNLAIRGAVAAYGLTHIVSAPTEHHAVTHPIEELAEAGMVQVHWLQVDPHGHIDLGELEDVLARAPRSLVSLMYGNNEIGTLHELAAIGEICTRYDALLHSDTVQAMGHLKLNFQSLPVHMATASAHKFYGPKGVGFLYLRKGTRVPPMITGGGQERNLRAGTENVPGIVGMAHALDRCYRDLEAKNAHLEQLKAHFRAGLEARFPGLRIHGDPARSLPTVLNVGFPGEGDDPMLLFHLDLRGIAASGGSACNSGANTGSHVLRAIGVPDAAQARAVRFSFGWQNTLAELDLALEAVADILAPA
ncbi:MAG: cysteine desulfurase [Bacteroidetes bacterium]|nr:MAG: cysteine desulfurase [Bacteroidota bacterium]